MLVALFLVLLSDLGKMPESKSAYARKLTGKLPILGTQSTKAPDLFDRLGTALQQSNSKSRFELTKLTPDLENRFMKEFTNSPWYRDFIQRSGGEKPNIGPSSDYDYRGAWLDSFEGAGGQITLDLNEPGAHGYSKSKQGKWLKNPQTHETSWKQWYQEISGNNPDESNLPRELAAKIIKGKMEGSYVHNPEKVY
jgi:hypothetical protein